MPRRLKRLLGALIYRNTAFSRQRVHETLAALEAAGVRAVVVGGWGVDALHGTQLRRHSDLDLLADLDSLDRAAGALKELGFESWHRSEDSPPLGTLPIDEVVALRDEALRVVELHGTDLAAADLTEGSIGGERVLCCSPDEQREAQARRVGRFILPHRRRSQRANVAAVEALEGVPASGCACRAQLPAPTDRERPDT